jgi:tRNA threonylcarbamoyladenosine biosynthesis protein TsaE
VSVSKYRTSSEDETIALGRALAKSLKRPSTVLLVGDLGAGKTTLTKGIVEGLGAASPEEVTSPTFTLVHDYGGGVFHVDLYRLETEREAASLGLDDFFERDDAVVLVEWGERFPRLFSGNVVRVDITAHEDTRELLVSGLE